MNLQSVPAVLSQYHTNWTNLDLGFNQYAFPPPFLLSLTSFNTFPSLTQSSLIVCSLLRFEVWPELNQFTNLVELWLTGNPSPSPFPAMASSSFLPLFRLLSHSLSFFPCFNFKRTQV